MTVRTAEHTQAAPRARKGWIGSKDEVSRFLRLVGADREGDGTFRLEGGIAAFMDDPSDDAEVVVTSDAVYFQRGRPVPLAEALVGTSNGLALRVFG